MKRRLPLVIAVGAVLAFMSRVPSPAVPPVADGSLDGGVRGWKTIRTVPAACDTPYRSIRADDDTVTAAHIGDTRTTHSPGCDPTWIFQVFECRSDQPSNVYCTVTFDASLWLVAGERAAVVIVAGANVSAYQIPGERSGKTGRYAASVAGAGWVTLAFAVWNSPETQAGTRSLLVVDNVESYPTLEDITSSLLTPLHPDAVPFDLDSIDGHLLQGVAGLADCNDNRLPDNYEVSQRMAFDRDADGRPDDCQEKNRQVDWVLLGLGVLILTVILVRLIRKNRLGNV